MDRMKTNRRVLLTRGTALAGGAVAASLLETGVMQPAVANGTGGSLITTDANTLVETGAGKVRGFTRNGIHTFKGIPYAASTEGANRFVAPAKPTPWTGVRSCMYYGPTCPQEERAGWRNDEAAFLFQWDDGQPAEDCLRVNLWTPGLNDGKKRPCLLYTSDAADE